MAVLEVGLLDGDMPSSSKTFYRPSLFTFIPNCQCSSTSFFRASPSKSHSFLLSSFIFSLASSLDLIAVAIAHFLSMRPSLGSSNIQSATWTGPISLDRKKPSVKPPRLGTCHSNSNRCTRGRQEDATFWNASFALVWRHTRCAINHSILQTELAHLFAELHAWELAHGRSTSWPSFLVPSLSWLEIETPPSWKSWSPWRRY